MFITNLEICIPGFYLFLLHFCLPRQVISDMFFIYSDTLAKGPRLQSDLMSMLRFSTFRSCDCVLHTKASERCWIYLQRGGELNVIISVFVLVIAVEQLRADY